MRQPPDWRGVRAGYDRAALGYDERHTDPRSVARFRVIDRPQLAITRGAERVLELGCGTGRLLEQADGQVRVGIDLSRLMLHRASSRTLSRRSSPGSIHLACADAHALPFGDCSFDAIIAGKGTFRYLDYDRAFAECARVLARGGKLAVHQYAASPWSIRRLTGRGGPSSADVLHIGDIDELIAPARRCGLVAVAVHRWRSIRIRPYALPIPPWLPGRWWSHCAVIFSSFDSRAGV